MAQIRLSHFAALDPRLKRLRKRTRRLRPVRPSRRVEMFYREQLVAIVDHLRRAGEELAKNLKATWPEPVAGDAASHETDLQWLRANASTGIRLSAGDARRLRAADETDKRLPRELEAAASKFGNIQATADRLTDVANRLSVTRRSLAEVDARLAKSVLDSIGVDITPYLDIDVDIAAAMRAAAKANVALIKSIPTQYLDQVRDTVNEAFRNGLRWEGMVARIKHVGDVTENRAKLIARDQVSKMTSAFNQSRQTQVGIEKYTWSTSHDERVRKSHADLNGHTFRWDSPPEVDGERAHPGFPVNCRCVSVPVIDLDDVHGGGTEEREAA